MLAAQKETPAGGAIHAAGVKQNDIAILPDNTAAINTIGADYVRQQAATRRAQLLAKAANFASLHAPHTLWQRRMKVGTTTLLVRLMWPGVLAVFDPATGSELARAEPGEPSRLANGFKPMSLVEKVLDDRAS